MKYITITDQNFEVVSSIVVDRIVEAEWILMKNGYQIFIDDVYPFFSERADGKVIYWGSDVTPFENPYHKDYEPITVQELFYNIKNK